MSGEENPMMDRFDPPDPDDADSEEETPEEQVDEPDSPDSTDKSDNTDNADNAAQASQPEETDKTDDSEGSNEDTRRNRPHTALYVSEELVDRVEERFNKINGQLMIDGEEPLEKHKHFYEGLLKAGLENDDLEEIVLDQRDG
ncbi:hypothetical protein ACFQMA_09205 [Halosimplex aquaticum]|uniref:DUF8160 domain-containing protein n=1 Tax=Halosimplex aquaticum TaxID=3026162 RepID=A0ABD5XY00_9EURY|nr:hypothetical protein [Halosimplex aquaticum]